MWFVHYEINFIIQSSEPIRVCDENKTFKRELNATLWHLLCDWKISMYILFQIIIAAAAAAASLQSCPTLCDPIEDSPPGSSPWNPPARTLEWVAISFSSAWRWKVKVKSLSHVRLLPIPWTAAYQAPPSMGFSRQEYWSGVPLPSSSDYH